MRKQKKETIQAEASNADRKMKTKNAGIPATENSSVRAKNKVNKAETVKSDEIEDELQVRKEVVQGLKQNDFDLEIPMDSGEDLDEGEDEDEEDDEGQGYDDEDVDEDSEDEYDTTGTENGEFGEEDDEDDDVVAGEMGTDDSGGETNGSELENTHHSEGKLNIQSTSKNTTGKTSNKMHEHVAGENIIGKTRRKNSDDGMSKTELEKIHLKGVMVSKPGHQGNNTGKSSKEVVKVVGGVNVEKVNANGNRDSGDLRRRAELENTLCSEAKLSQLSGGKKDTGKATNERSKSRATNLDKNKATAGGSTGQVGAGVGADGARVGAGAAGVAGQESAAMGVGAGKAWAADGPKKSFAQLFKSENANGNGIQLQLSGEENSDEDLQIKDVDVEDTSEAWGHSLIGYIAGKNPSYNAVIGFCKSWTKKCRVHFDSSGWIVVKFDEEEDLKRILEGGPYLIYGKPFIVKEMPKYFCYDKSEICKAQVWVNLPHLPLELWTEKALSKIGSRIGHPILVDSITASKERASFARILVEVDLAKVLREDIALILPNGRRIVQEVRYEHLPSYCDDCHAIGHDGKACARRKDQVEGRKLKRAELVPTVVEHRKPNIGVPSDLVSQKTSNLHTSDASTASMGDNEEGSEDEFVEYVSKNRKKALAKAKWPIGQASQGSRPSGKMVGVTRPIEHRAGGAKHASEGVLSRVRDSSRGDDRGNMKTVGSGLGKPGLTKEGGTSIAPRRGSHANLL